MRGERIEWEEIERRKHQIARVTRGGLASTAEERELEYIAALEAGEAMAVRLRSLLDLMELKSPGRMMLGEYELKAIEALDAWRRCVAPRGEGA